MSLVFVHLLFVPLHAVVGGQYVRDPLFPFSLAVFSLLLAVDVSADLFLFLAAELVSAGSVRTVVHLVGQRVKQNFYECV